MGNLLEKYKTSPNPKFLDVEDTAKYWVLASKPFPKPANDNGKGLKPAHNRFSWHKLIKKVVFKWRLWCLDRRIRRLSARVRGRK